MIEIKIKRKGPPYEIEFGSKGQIPPAYVDVIYEDRISLGGLLKQLSLNNEISFTECGQIETNTELVEIMLKLNESGVVFSYDPKSMISPSWFMQNLQDKGLLKKPFKEILWLNKKTWALTTYELV